jgi:hypothetical protein
MVVASVRSGHAQMVVASVRSGHDQMVVASVRSGHDEMVVASVRSGRVPPAMNGPAVRVPVLVASVRSALAPPPTAAPDPPDPRARIGPRGLAPLLVVADPLVTKDVVDPQVADLRRAGREPVAPTTGPGATRRAR